MQKEFLIPAKSTEIEFIERKSRFIGYIKPVENEAEAQDFLHTIRTRHYDATHNVYAYQIGPFAEIQRSNDDGEPSGTAGKPVLEAIKKHEMTNTIIIVTRYFGGILLGAGGLTRAYGKTAVLAIEAAGLIKRVPAQRLLLTFDYPLIGKIEAWLAANGYKADNKNYGEKIAFSCLLPVDMAKQAKIDITEISNGLVRIDDLGMDGFLSINI